MAFAVADQQFDLALRNSIPDSRNCAGETACTVVGQIISRHRGDHGIFQAELLDGFSHPTRFVEIERLRFTSVDQAETTGPGATFAIDHERCRAIVPAFEDVGATSFFTHRDQFEVTHDSLESGVFGTHVRLYPHPVRFGRSHVETLVDTGVGQPTQKTHWRAPGLLSRRLSDPWRVARPFAPRERAQILGDMTPCHISPVDSVCAPSPSCPSRDDVDDVVHRSIDAFGLQRGHGLICDSTWHEPVEPVVVDVDIQCESME